MVLPDLIVKRLRLGHWGGHLCECVLGALEYEGGDVQGGVLDVERS